MANAKKMLRRKAALERLKQQLVVKTKNVKQTYMEESTVIVGSEMYNGVSIPIKKTSKQKVTKIVAVLLNEEDVQRIEKEIAHLQKLIQ